MTNLSEQPPDTELAKMRRTLFERDQEQQKLDTQVKFLRSQVAELAEENRVLRRQLGSSDGIQAGGDDAAEDAASVDQPGGQPAVHYNYGSNEDDLLPEPDKKSRRHS